jgi:CheY-like chemotaxis protein
MAIFRASSRIVLAEDNPADVGLVREALREHQVDCELRVIFDGEEALAFIDRLEGDARIPCPDLLLLDLHLPKHDGQEVLKYFRASGRCSQTPVVILTSSDPAWIKCSTLPTLDFVDFFQKPPSLGQFMHLGSLVKEVIRRSQA